jgi:hypothetical protein
LETEIQPLILFFLPLSPDPDLKGYATHEHTYHSTHVIGKEGHLGNKKGGNVDAKPYDT